MGRWCQDPVQFLFDNNSCWSPRHPQKWKVVHYLETWTFLFLFATGVEKELWIQQMCCLHRIGEAVWGQLSLFLEEVGCGRGGGGSILFLKTYVLSVWSCLYYLKSVAVPLLLYHVSVHFLPLCFCNDPHLFANCFQMCLVLSLTPRPFCQYSSHSFC